MNIALRSAMTVADYLAWAEAHGEVKRVELINGRVVAQSSESVGHNRTKGALLNALHRALAKTDLVGEAFTNGLAVPIDAYTAYDPDATVRCGKPLAANEMTVSDPIIVVEVTSPSTGHTDTSAKLIGYFKLASVAHYLVIDPDARTVMHHIRGADGAVAARALDQGTLTLDPPGLTVVVADLFG